MISSGVLEIEFPDGGKVIEQPPRLPREVWVAARSGGFHFRVGRSCLARHPQSKRADGVAFALLSAQSGESINSIELADAQSTGFDSSSSLGGSDSTSAGGRSPGRSTPCSALIRNRSTSIAPVRRVAAYDRLGTSFSAVAM